MTQTQTLRRTSSRRFHQLRRSELRRTTRLRSLVLRSFQCRFCFEEDRNDTIRGALAIIDGAAVRSEISPSSHGSTEVIKLQRRTVALQTCRADTDSKCQTSESRITQFDNATKSLQFGCETTITHSSSEVESEVPCLFVSLAAAPTKRFPHFTHVRQRQRRRVESSWQTRHSQWNSTPLST